MSDACLIEWVRKFAGQRVAVVGDLMLDRYIWGRASRISQEAPVPVVRVDHETFSPGGAANVVRNLCTLGADVSAYGTIGSDAHGARLSEWFEQSGVDVRGVVRSEERETTVKTRVLAGTQQVVRVDREDTVPLDASLQERLFDVLAGQMRDGMIDGVILEDYAKGVLTDALVGRIAAEGRDRGVPVVLDPHPSNAFASKGLTLLTPNRAEAFALAGRYYQGGVLPVAKDRPLLEVGQQLLDDWEMKLLLITLGAHGMVLFEDGSVEPHHIPTRAREVFDVSGAGDTVIATFLLALVAGSTPIEAARLANHAAGLVVAEVGTAAIGVEDLVSDLQGDHG